MSLNPTLVLLDAELATLYATTTKRFNERVRRNVARFPAAVLSYQSHIVPSFSLAMGSCLGEYGNFAASASLRVTP